LHVDAPNLLIHSSREIDREITGKIISSCFQLRRGPPAYSKKPLAARTFAGRRVSKQHHYSISGNISGISRETQGRLDVVSKFVIRFAVTAAVRQRPVINLTFERTLTMAITASFLPGARVLSVFGDSLGNNIKASRDAA
jgi:hypothetical protein